MKWNLLNQNQIQGTCCWNMKQAKEDNVVVPSGMKMKMKIEKKNDGQKKKEKKKKITMIIKFKKKTPLPGIEPGVAG